jgi:hypothetical protein
MPDHTESARRSRIVLVVAVMALVVVAALVIWSLPHTASPSGFAATNPEVAPDAAVVVLLQIDSIDAASGRVSARVSVARGPAMPAEGVKVLVGSVGQHVVTVTPEADSVGQPVVFDFDRGSVSSYPFDRYRFSEPIAALPATSTETLAAQGTTTLPLQVLGNASAFGFEVTDADVTQPDPSRVDVTLAVQRVPAHRIWASAMMAIDWALAVAAATVVISIAWRARSWETRHLAWLGSMIFALAAFRTTAPGGPPVGVFMDTAAFFWAEALVVLSLVVLVVLFLTRPRDELE